MDEVFVQVKNHFIHVDEELVQMKKAIVQVKNGFRQMDQPISEVQKFKVGGGLRRSGFAGDPSYLSPGHSVTPVLRDSAYSGPQEKRLITIFK